MINVKKNCCKFLKDNKITKEAQLSLKLQSQQLERYQKASPWEGIDE